MANYIHALREQRSDLANAIIDSKTALDELVSYLCSPKFHTDTTVQVQDVLSRLEPLKSAVLDGLHKYDNFGK